MATLLLGCAALIAILLLGRLFVTASAGQLARAGRFLGGSAMLAAAAFLGARGLFVLAGPLGLAGLGLMGLGSGAFGSRTRKSRGQTSHVRSAFLEMELDHDSGAMEGRILAGPHAGQSLGALPVATLAALLPDLDDQSRALLMAYLDRREPGWSERAQANGQAAGPDAPARGNRMTHEEAYQILGLAPGASAEEIGNAHRALMKKLHPDTGGSTWLAARVNEAKDTLLRRR